MENFEINNLSSSSTFNSFKAQNALNELSSKEISPSVISNPSDIVNFKSEFNIGLALPFEFCKNKKQDKFEKHSMTKWFDENNNLHRLEVVFRGNSGAAGKLDQDVLNILMSMCVEQKTDSPVFTYEEIRKRLGLSKGSHGNIRDSIQRMLGMTIEFKKSFYSTSGSKNVDVEKHLIQSRKSVVNEDYADLKNLDARHSVTFDKDIMQNLLGGYYSVLSRETYLSLDSGAVRRLYQLIVSHRDVGKRNVFTLEIEDIASVLGLTNKKEFFGNIKKYFESLKTALPDLDYVFATVERKKVVKISFPETHLLAQGDQFLDALVKWYGEEALITNDITEDFISDLRAKYPAKVEFEKTKVYLCELLVDMVLFQKITNRGQIKSVRAIIFASLNKQMEYTKPEGYKRFVVERIKLKDIQETKELALKEVERKKFEVQITEKKTRELAALTFETIKKEPKVYGKYEKEAYKLYGEEIKSSLLGEQILEERIKELIQARMEAGEQIMS
jgi:Replication initiator protein A